jgi:hypothetical protein
MSTHGRAQRPGTWNVRSVSVRKRDAQHRLAHVYRLLLDGFAQDSTPEANLHPVSLTTEPEEANACRHLCESLDGSSTTEPDH